MAPPILPTPAGVRVGWQVASTTDGGVVISLPVVQCSGEGVQQVGGVSPATVAHSRQGAAATHCTVTAACLWLRVAEVPPLIEAFMAQPPVARVAG